MKTAFPFFIHLKTSDNSAGCGKNGKKTAKK